jgi:hypothetical protein
VGVAAAAGSASGAEVARADNTRTRPKIAARVILIMAATVADLKTTSRDRAIAFTLEAGA